jgi:hypothetical protein
MINGVIIPMQGTDVFIKLAGNENLFSASSLKSGSLPLHMKRRIRGSREPELAEISDRISSSICFVEHNGKKIASFGQVIRHIAQPSQFEALIRIFLLSSVMACFGQTLIHRSHPCATRQML